MKTMDFGYMHNARIFTLLKDFPSLDNSKTYTLKLYSKFLCSKVVTDHEVCRIWGSFRLQYFSPLVVVPG